MKPPAYCLMTVSKIIPEKVWEAAQIFNRRAFRKSCQEIQGLHQMLLIESQEEPGRLIWISTWDRMADSQAFLGSPCYADLMAEMRPYFLRMPEWYWYSVLEALPEKRSPLAHRKEADFE